VLVRGAAPNALQKNAPGSCPRLPPTLTCVHARCGGETDRFIAFLGAVAPRVPTLSSRLSPHRPASGTRIAAFWLATTLLIAPAHAGEGGPDASGNAWYDVNSGCPVVADTFFLANSTNFSGSSIAGPLDLGFRFPFYDGVVTQCWLHANGMIFFAPPRDLPHPNGLPIPTVDGDAGFLAPYWSSVVPAAPAATWQSFPDEGVFKATFNCARALDGTRPLQYEVYLFADGGMRIEYLAPGNGTAVTIGMESFDEAEGLVMRRDSVGYGGLTYGRPTPFSICITRKPHLDCSAMDSIACGERRADSTPAAPASSVEDYGCSAATWDGREAVYKLILTEVADVDIALTGFGGRTMSAFLLSDCNEFRCLGGGESFRAESLLPGSYELVVDSAAGSEGAFTLETTCTSRNQPIACGDTVSGSTLGGPTNFATQGCMPGALWGREAYYLLDFTPPGDINASLTSALGHVVTLYDADAPVVPEACLAGGVGSAVLYDPPAGRYLVVVDGPAGSEGPYTLRLTCRPRLSCAGATRLECQQHVDSSTVGLPRRVDLYRCGDAQMSGPEAVYRFDNFFQQVVSFVLETAEPDLSIVLLSACDESECLDVDGDSISRDLAPGTYYLVVDGADGAAAAYTLSAVCGVGLEPAFISVTGAAGACFTEHKRAWLTPEIEKADVLFAIDLTGSMGDERAQLQQNMEDIVARLQSFIQDVGFGLVSYKDYPGQYIYAAPCPYSNTYGNALEYPYRLEQPITTSVAAIEAAVNGLPPASGGFDDPESYLRELHESAADPATGWRPGSRRLIVDFGDELPHDCNVLSCLGDVGTPLGVDPGRDMLAATADDLTLEGVMDELHDASIALLHLDSSGGGSHYGAGGTPYSYAEIWNCWATRAGGVATALERDGSVPGGIDLSELIADLVRAQGARCEQLQLVAEPDYASWLAAANPIYIDVALPAVREFDILVCVPQGVPVGTYTFRVDLTCSGSAVASQTIRVHVVDDCSPSIVSSPRDAVICLGESVTLDARGMNVVNCSGGAEWAWNDADGNPVGQSPQLQVRPTETTTYSVTVYCASDGGCSATEEIVVDVQQRPLLFTGSVADPSPCTVGLTLAWDDALFLDPSGSGSYNIYRSEIDCADAMQRPPINPPDLVTPGWTDEGTRPGRTYFYVVQAEDARRDAACDPGGPNNGGATSLVNLCLGPITDEAPFAEPALLGWGLRVRHLGQEITADWTRSRALLPEEHFHLLKGIDPSVLIRVNPEADLSHTFIETDVSARLQFFDTRIANTCEHESADDEPPGYDP